MSAVTVLGITFYSTTMVGQSRTYTNDVDIFDVVSNKYSKSIYATLKSTREFMVSVKCDNSCKLPPLSSSLTSTSKTTKTPP